ncbi:pentapeptide repeat-containing protein [Brevibacillus reuszeri]|uniref:pentapeptide repeat-containing protein n=1 Tax=Brevibacillus TaxID=55080 RepID=UPI000CCC2E53|nr:pentapeptide repeat-containing protein [Brevibacillus reuszeri]
MSNAKVRKMMHDIQRQFELNRKIDRYEARFFYHLPAITDEMTVEEKAFAREFAGYEEDFSHQDWSGMEIRNRTLQASQFEGANLSNLRAFETDFLSANMEAATLKNAFLHRAKLDFVSFRGADLTHANLSHASLYMADFTGADLSGANFTHADLSGAILHNACLYGADLTQANLTEADVTDASFQDATMCKTIRKDMIGWTEWHQKQVNWRSRKEL